MTILAVVRHGVTDWNVSGRKQGQTDVPLNEEGLEQARKVAAYLQRERWDAVYSSDLQRAYATALAVAEAAGVETVRVDKRLRERSFGLLEGLAETEIVARWGPDYRSRDAELDMEPMEALYGRAVAFLDDTVRRHAGGRVVAVTHGGWIVRTLNGLFPDLSFDWIGNTSVTMLKYDGAAWHPVVVNALGHLDSPE